MKLIIDGYVYWARMGQSLLDILGELGLVTGKLSTDPIAAKIAGEVFTLNYIPMREKDGAQERESIRKAMMASDGRVGLLRYGDPSGKDVYRRTAQFVIFLALRRLWPKARAKMNCTVGSGMYIKVTGAEDFSAERLKACVQEIGRLEIFPMILIFAPSIWKRKRSATSLQQKLRNLRKR